MIAKLIDEPFWPGLELEIKKYSDLYWIPMVSASPHSPQRNGMTLLEEFTEAFFYNVVVIPLEKELFKTTVRYPLTDYQNHQRDEKKFIEFIEDNLKELKTFWVDNIKYMYLRSGYEMNKESLIYPVFAYRIDDHIHSIMAKMKNENNMTKIIQLTKEVVTYQIKTSLPYKEVNK